MKHTAKGLIAVFATFGLTGAAYAGDRETASLSISASVPLVCEINAPVLVIDPAQNQAAGQVFEMCNSGSGFRVLASHRPLAASEQVQLSYGAAVSALSPSGLTEVARRHGARIGVVPISVISSDLGTSLAVGLAITAI